MMSLACKDTGIESCDFVAKGETAADVMKTGKEHAMAAHADKISELKKSMTDEQMEAAAMKAMKTA